MHWNTQRNTFIINVGHLKGCHLQRNTFIINVFLCKWPLWRWPTGAKTCRKSITKLQIFTVTCKVSWIKYCIINYQPIFLTGLSKLIVSTWKFVFPCSSKITRWNSVPAWGCATRLDIGLLAPSWKSTVSWILCPSWTPQETVYWDVGRKIWETT